MSTAGPPPLMMGRSEVETNRAGYDGQEKSVTLMCHFDENAFLEFRIGAFKRLKRRIQYVDMLVQLYEKELGVDKVRQFRAEVKVKLRLQHASSATIGSTGAPNDNTTRIQNSQSTTMPFWSGNIAQIETKDNRQESSKVVATTVRSTTTTDPMPRSSKSSDVMGNCKEGETSRIQVSSSSAGLERAGETDNHGDGGTLPNPNFNQKCSTSVSNQQRKPADDGLRELEVTKRRKKRNTSDSKASDCEILEIVEDTPDNVLEQIQRGLSGPLGRFEFTIISCIDIHIGSYTVSAQDAGPLTATVTPLGITFKLPHCISKDRKVNVCIPKRNILSIFVNLLDGGLHGIYLKTGPRYATWIRGVLGMDGNIRDQQTNYYCPQNGAYGQKTIYLLAESLSQSGIGLIRKVFLDKLKEIDCRSR